MASNANARTTPLNFKVRKATARFIRQDADKLKKTLDAMGDKILMWFFTTKTLKERAAFFASLPAKTKGRRVAP